MFIAYLKDQYLLPQRNNTSKALHFCCIRISSIIAEYAFCRLLLSLFHSKIVISNSKNTLTLLQNWKRLFVFLTLWLLEVSASLTCLIVHVNRHFEPWGPNSVLHVWPERKAAFCPWATTSRSKQGDRETTQLCSQGPLCPLVSFSTCTPNIHNHSQTGWPRVC